jgi:archaellum component FlaC
MPRTYWGERIVGRGMNQASPRPEQVIRQYLETHEGPVESHVLHLKQTFQFEDLSPQNLKRAADALREVEVRVEPPLDEVAADGRLTLSIAEHGRRQTEGTRIRESLLRRVPTKNGASRQRRAGGRRRERAALAAARDVIVAETIRAGVGGARLEHAFAVLEGAAGSPQETLAALDYLLDSLGAAVERRLDEVERALTGTRAARKRVDARLAELEDGLAELLEHTESGRGAEQTSRLLRGLSELRILLSPDGPDGAAVQSALEANRAALKTLRPALQLHPIRERCLAELDAAQPRPAGPAAEELSRRLQDVETTLRDREDELARVRSEAQARQDAQRGEVGEARSEVEELRARAEQSERQVEQLAGELAQRAAELEQAHSEPSAPHGDIRRRLRETEQKLAAREAELEKALAGETDARGQVTKLTEELEDARERLARRRLERSDVRADHLVEAIESVRRALTDGIDEQPPSR